MASTLTVAFTATPLAAGVKMKIYATRQLSPGISFQPRGAYKLILVTAAAAASPANVATAYIAKFGALISGKKILFRLIPVDGTTGETAPGTDVSMIVT